MSARASVSVMPYVTTLSTTASVASSITGVSTPANARNAALMFAGLEPERKQAAHEVLFRQPPSDRFRRYEGVS
jgi:hypothetical protein